MDPGDDVRVVEDTERRFGDGAVLRVRVLAVPESNKFADGIKYRLHYGPRMGTHSSGTTTPTADTNDIRPMDSTKTTNSLATMPSKSASGTRSNGSAMNREPQNNNKL